jgi:hypothetical protein
MVDSVQSKWAWFLVLGVVLILGGLLAITLPAISTIAASLVLGVVLSLSGVVKIIKAFRVTGWPVLGVNGWRGRGDLRCVDLLEPAEGRHCDHRFDFNSIRPGWH